MIAALEAGDPREVGPYRIVARLGAGGMGRVYLGLSRGGRSVAVKVVHPELASDRDFRKRFARETEAARRVNGLFTAGVVDADPHGVPAWLATAYIAGVSLADAVTEHGALPQESVAALGAGLAEALDAIHGAGLIHRDLKPSNVLLAADGPRVIDFGISVAGEATALTRTGVVVGTPGFMSPEQLTGTRVGPASDVFSLGAVLAFAARAAGPFGVGSVQALLFRIAYEPPDLEGIPEPLRNLVARCLAKEPGQRPSVPEVLQELAGLATSHGAAPARGMDWLPEPLAHTIRTRTADLVPTTTPRTPELSATASPTAGDEAKEPGPRIWPGETVLPAPEPAQFAGNSQTAPDIGQASTQTAPAGRQPLPATPPSPANLNRTERPDLRAESPVDPGTSSDKRPRLTRRAMLLLGATAVGAVGVPSSIYLTKSSPTAPSRTAQPLSTSSPTSKATPTPSRPVRQLSAESGADSLAFSPDGKILAGGCGDGAVRLWNPVTGKLTATLELKDSAEERYFDFGGVQVAFSPDGTTLASTSGTRTLRLWNPTTGKLTATDDRLFSTVYELTFSPDGKYLAMAQNEGTVRLRHQPTEPAVTTIYGQVVSVAFSPDGKILAGGCEDGAVRLWNPATGKLTTALKDRGPSTGRVNAVAFGPDGQILAGGCGDGAVRLWNPATGKLTAILKGHTESVESVVFSPEGNVLASGAADRTVRLWEPATGRTTGVLTGHTESVTNVVFSPDGKILASGGLEHTVKLWDL